MGSAKEVVGAAGAAIVGSRGGPNFFFVLSTSAAPPTFRIFFSGSLNKSLASFSSTVRPGPSKRRRNEVDEEGAFCQADFWFFLTAASSFSWKSSSTQMLKPLGLGRLRPERNREPFRCDSKPPSFQRVTGPSFSFFFSILPAKWSHGTAVGSERLPPFIDPGDPSTRSLPYWPPTAKDEAFSSLPSTKILKLPMVETPPLFLALLRVAWAAAEVLWRPLRVFERPLARPPRDDDAPPFLPPLELMFSLNRVKSWLACVNEFGMGSSSCEVCFIQCRAMRRWNCFWRVAKTFLGFAIKFLPLVNTLSANP